MLTEETMESVLGRAGWPLGRYGRTTCPIHQGDNAQAFRYWQFSWICYAGCGRGTAVELAKKLSLPPVNRLRGLPLDYVPLRRLPLSAKLLRAARRIALDYLMETTELHRTALFDLHAAHWLVPGNNPYRLTPDELDRVMLWIADAHDRLAEAHRRLGEDCCRWKE